MKRRASSRQIQFIRTLTDQVGMYNAREVSRCVLSEDVYRLRDYQPHSWSREQVLDHITGSDATRLISALLDKAGRKGRRKNNRKATNV